MVAGELLFLAGASLDDGEHMWSISVEDIVENETTGDIHVRCGTQAVRSLAGCPAEQRLSP